VLDTVPQHGGGDETPSGTTHYRDHLEDRLRIGVFSRSVRTRKVGRSARSST
jgi:hypothetical protein